MTTKLSLIVSEFETQEQADSTIAGSGIRFRPRWMTRIRVFLTMMQWQSWKRDGA